MRTDLSSDSLKKLKAIAKTEILRQQVQTLFIQSTNRKDFGAELPWSHDEDDHLLSSQPSAQVLQSILCQQMPNRRSFYIHGPTNEANDRINLSTTEVTTWILSVVAETGLNIRSFSVDLIGEHLSSTSYGSGWLRGLRLQASSMRQGTKFRKGWAHLQFLHLHLDIKSDTASWTCDLVPNLKKLSLAFCSSDEDACLKVLALELPPLKELCLSGTYVTEAVLLRFLTSSRPSLQALTLRLIYLDASLDASGSWRSVLKGFRDDFTQLKSISLLGIHRIGSTTHTPGGSSQRSRVFFTPLAQGAPIPGTQGEQFDLRIKKLRQKPRVFAISYKGHHVKEALTVLEEYVEYIEPHML